MRARENNSLPSLLRCVLALLLLLAPGLAWGQSVTQASPPFWVFQGAGASTPYVPTGITSSIDSLFIGLNAGAAYPISTETSGYGAVGIGAGALQNLTATGNESTAIGILAAQYVQSPTSGITALGMHALGADILATGTIAIGNDAVRDAMNATGIGGVVAVGYNALAHGVLGTTSVAVGSTSLSGNSLAVIISGSKTTGDVITLAITCSGTITVSNCTQSPTYTVLAGDTIQSIATGVSNALQALANTITDKSFGFKVALPFQLPDNTWAVQIAFPGDSTVGWGLNIAPSVSGAATEVVTVSGGSTGDNNTAVGYQALAGLAATTANGNTAVGTLSAPFVTTAQANSCFGFQSCQSLQTGLRNVGLGVNALNKATTAQDNTAVGHSALTALTTATFNVALGKSAGAAITSSGTNVTIGVSSGNKITTGSGANVTLGPNVASTTLATGNNNVVIGTTSGCDTAAAATANSLTLCAGGGGLITVTGGNAPSTSITTVAGSETVTGGIGPAGGFSSSPRNFNTCDMGPNSATSAYTAQTPVTTEFYVSEVFVPANVTVTGVAVFNSATISGNVKVGLANSAGVNVATSASTAMAGTTSYQRVPFTGTYAAVGPATYYVTTFYDNATVRPNTITQASCGVQKATGQVYSTGFTSFTPSGTFVTALGPVASLY